MTHEMITSLKAFFETRRPREQGQGRDFKKPAPLASGLLLDEEAKESLTACIRGYVDPKSLTPNASTN